MTTRDGRTEVVVAATVLAKLLDDGIVHRSGTTLALACHSVGVEVREVSEAHARLQVVGYQGPRRIHAALAVGDPPPPPRLPSRGAKGSSYTRPDRRRKQCQLCGTAKQLIAFDRKVGTADGRDAVCKRCTREREQLCA